MEIEGEVQAPILNLFGCKQALKLDYLPSSEKGDQTDVILAESVKTPKDGKMTMNIRSEVHHKIQQKDANIDGFIDNLHKNHISNLMNLCEKCHKKVHNM